MRKEKIHWGIIGLGKIAKKFATDLRLLEDAKLYAVASRTEEKAITFSQDFQAITHYSRYEDLAKDPEIDVVYIAVPHPFHCELTLMCLEHGKAVLCEKPMGMHANEVHGMIQKARSKQLFLMEGLWTRFIPATEKLLELLKQKVIGEIQALEADFGFEAPYDSSKRLFNKQLGGGSLLDIGIYPLYLSLLCLGKPESIEATAVMSNTSVDSSTKMQLNYSNAVAKLESSFEEETPTEAVFYGSKGKIILHNRFHHARQISVHLNDSIAKEIDLDYPSYGYSFEIQEVNNCIRKGLVESPKLSHQMSLDLIELLDQVRSKIGLEYPK